jgi:hypothetical protein
LRRGGVDGWLQNLHGLLLMDDTVVFAMSWQKMMQKLSDLNESIKDIGMIINASKSQFLCVNGDNSDSFDLDGTLINYTDQYIYLGVPISVSSIANQVKLCVVPCFVVVSHGLRKTSEMLK